VQGRRGTLGSGNIIRLPTKRSVIQAARAGTVVSGRTKGFVWFHQSFLHTLVERHKTPVKPSVDHARASDDSARRCKSGVVG